MKLEMRSLVFLTALVLLANQVLSQNFCGGSFTDAKKCQTPCPSGTDRECPAGETCFANVPCSTAPAPPNSGSFVVSEQLFSQLFPVRDPLYTYAGLASAASAYEGFAKTGSIETQKREAAAFLANIAHESGNLKYTREIDMTKWDDYCNNGTALGNGFSASCIKSGKKFQYFGRGPIQLSWNYNYLTAGEALGIDLINDPDRVATDATVAWKTAIWFWMTQTGPGSIAPHNAMITGAGFGETIRSINGALECDGKRPDIVSVRVGYYERFVQVLGTSNGPGSLQC